jgi:hypothetical protein
MNTLALRFGPFAAQLNTPFGGVVDALHQLYPDESFIDIGTFCDFRVDLAPGKYARRCIAARRISCWTAKARSNRCPLTKRCRCSNGASTTPSRRRPINI